MAKRKPARPASHTRTPGAARGSRATKAAARSAASRPKPARKSAAARTAGRKNSPNLKKGATASRGVKKAAGRKTAPRVAARTARGSTDASAARAGRTIVTRRHPAGKSGSGSAATPPRHEYGARGSGTRLRQIERDRRIVEDEVPTPPSSLDLDRRPSAARAGRAEMEEALQEHTAAGPDLTAGDIDADWESAYSTGDEAPGGDMPTPDQAVVEEIGTAIGVEYADNEELKGVDKIEERDRHRWELDPASSEDYQDRARERPERPKAKAKG